MLEGDVLGQSGKPILGRLGFPVRPLDQQPFFAARLAQPGIAMRRPHALPCKTRGEPVRGALAPRDGLPDFGRQTDSQRLAARRAAAIWVAARSPCPAAPATAACPARRPTSWESPCRR